MRALLAVLLLGGLAGCNNSSSPTAPPPAPEPVPTQWSGSRQVVELVEGQGTCLGGVLGAQAPQTVRLVLPPPQTAAAIGSVQILEPEDFCSVAVLNDGTTVSWDDFRCSQSCWFASFQCNGRNWSYCRTRDDFHGTEAGSELGGSQIETYRATNGQTEYVVRARYSYRLSRD